MDYRREIDGLRAVAVLPVIFFHAGLPFFSGGFVGVDVFFVISGYLITSIILAEHKAGSFSLLRFYERRARRILPALLLVIVACLPFAYLWMLPDELTAFSESILAVVGFVSNLYFWRQTGYFETAAELKPLLHTWSLAVEEQYYVFFPLVMMWLLRRRPHILWSALVILFCISLLVAQTGGNIHLAKPYVDKIWDWEAVPSWGFFLLPARGWELLSGALVAVFISLRGPLPQSHVRDQLGSLLGLGLLSYVIIFYDSATPHPSVYTLLPVLSAVLLILFAYPNTLVGGLLASPILVGIGLVSYSAYLWHQPLFVFSRLAYPGDMSALFIGALICSTFLLAYLSWRYVEQPFRNRHKISRSMLISVVLTVSLILIGIGVVGIKYEGFANRFDVDQYDLISPAEKRAEYVYQRHAELVNLGDFSASSAPKLAIIGDSFSQDVVNVIAEMGAFNGYELRAHYIPARCQIYYGSEDVGRFIHPMDKQLCRKDYNSKLQSLVNEADVVIFAAMWREWAVERLGETLVNLVGDKGDKDILIIGSKDFGKIQPHRYIGLDANERIQIRNPVSEEHQQINKLMRERLDGFSFVDLHALICGRDAPDCPVFNAEGKLLSHDGGHLTQAGAIFLGERLFDSSLLAKYK